MTIQKRSREEIAVIIAKDIPDGSYVNLGIGLPTNVANICLKTRKSFYILKMEYWHLAHRQHQVKKIQI